VYCQRLLINYVSLLSLVYLRYICELKMDWLADNAEIKPNLRKPWKILIVDDDHEVHKSTKLAMKLFVFMGRGLQFINAYSGAEAKAILVSHNDIAVILLDVVMETDDAGLKLVDFIRNELNNSSSRIVLRTGQAGLAPESEIIKNYDIDGYKAKTEVTQNSLYHLFYISLRSYRDIYRLGSYKNALKALLNSVLKVDKLDDLDAFSTYLLRYLTEVLDAYEAELIVNKKTASQICIKSGKHAIFNARTDIHTEINATAFIDAVSTKQGLCYEGKYVGVYYRSNENIEAVVILEVESELDSNAIELVEIFAEHVCSLIEKLIG
jgi:CheY-like chemotaxis protein